MLGDEELNYQRKQHFYVNPTNQFLSYNNVFYEQMGFNEGVRSTLLFFPFFAKINQVQCN